MEFNPMKIIDNMLFTILNFLLNPFGILVMPIEYKKGLIDYIFVSIIWIFILIISFDALTKIMRMIK